MLRRNGFTLIEIVVVIVLTGIIAGIVATLIMQAARAYSDEQLRSGAQYQTRLAVERISREARQVRRCAEITAPANPSATLQFTDITGAAVSFAVAGGNLTRGADVLASGVTSAQPFRFLDRSGNPTTSCVAPNDIWYVEVDVSTALGAEIARVRTRVHPGNFF
jgi:prepilin-type N-terminal cleavage/methylation domain-containing protein